MECKLCRCEKELIDAHIIPESFFETKGKTTPVVELTSSEEIYPKRRPIGIYDPTILCKECEKIFDKWDDYGYKLLCEKTDERKIIMNDDSGIILERYDNYDYFKLKMFFVSVLWRAAVSNNIFFSHVSLGPYLEKIRNIVLNNNLDSDDEFDVFLTRHTNIKGPIHFPPNPERYADGVRFYKVYLGRVMFHIKVDKRSTPSTI